MKVGDLVRYKDFVQGLSGLTGIIVGWNGECPMILWQYTGKVDIAMPDFIEVVSESR